ncbi:uncharacterized protein LOC127862693 isoform X2 [Dreissena polymorpha]|uniref:uncharacterized protein LOC127862693 isoform X2 n=1 Tax=Dreissena polymorpha TaxID=45954 RepID=UPI002263B4E3|nr:uncharacterized protein LOC127862693 isoform X2 [Dreissena polymorpha]
MFKHQDYKFRRLLEWSCFLEALNARQEKTIQMERGLYEELKKECEMLKSQISTDHSSELLPIEKLLDDMRKICVKNEETLVKEMGLLQQDIAHREEQNKKLNLSLQSVKSCSNEDRNKWQRQIETQEEHIIILKKKKKILQNRLNTLNETVEVLRRESALTLGVRSEPSHQLELLIEKETQLEQEYDETQKDLNNHQMLLSVYERQEICNVDNDINKQSSGVETFEKVFSDIRSAEKEMILCIQEPNDKRSLEEKTAIFQSSLRQAEKMFKHQDYNFRCLLKRSCFLEALNDRQEKTIQMERGLYEELMKECEMLKSQISTDHSSELLPIAKSLEDMRKICVKNEETLVKEMDLLQQDIAHREEQNRKLNLSLQSVKSCSNEDRNKLQRQIETQEEHIIILKKKKKILQNRLNELLPIEKSLEDMRKICVKNEETLVKEMDLLQQDIAHREAKNKKLNLSLHTLNETVEVLRRESALTLGVKSEPSHQLELLIEKETQLEQELDETQKDLNNHQMLLSVYEVMEKKTKEMSSVELKADGEDVLHTCKSTKTQLDSSNETSILMTDNARSSGGNSTDIESLNTASKKQEKTNNEHDNVDVTYQEEEAVKADSSKTEFNKAFVKSQEAVKTESFKTDCVTHQEEAVKVGNLLIIDSGISSNVDSGCPEVTTKTPDHLDGQTKKKEKKHFMKRFFSFATYNFSFEDEEHKENIKHAMEKFEYFWLKDDVFSQLHESKFEVRGQIFCNAEQYMMYMKADLFGDDRTAKKIMKTSDPKKIKALGRKVFNFHEPMWRAHCLDVVRTANLAKFSQNKKLKEKLFKTHPKILVKASPYDKIWGIGLAADEPEAFVDTKWKGSNFLGYILTEVRDQLMCEEGQITAENKMVFLKSLKEAYCAELVSWEPTQWHDAHGRSSDDTCDKSMVIQSKGDQQSAQDLNNGVGSFGDKLLVYKDRPGFRNKHNKAQSTEKHSTSSGFTQNSYDEFFPEISEDQLSLFKKKRLVEKMKMKVGFDMEEAGASNNRKENRNKEHEQPKQHVFSSDKDDALGRTSEETKSKSKNTVEIHKEESRDANETIAVEYKDRANVLLNVSEFKSETRNIPNDEAIFAKAEKDNDDEHQDKMNSMLSELQSEPTKTNESSKSNSGDVVEHEDKTNKLLNSFRNISSIGNSSNDGAPYNNFLDNERDVAVQPIDVERKPKEKLYETVGLTNKDEKKQPDKKVQKHYPGTAKKVTESNTKKKKK